MCGISGILLDERASQIDVIDSILQSVNKMMAAMTLRGPDGSGIWFDSSRRVFLGHRRLAIIDLSDNAAQPMVSSSGRYVIVFNGEIYNYKSLKSSLESRGYFFKTNSDTEVILALFETEGEAMFSKLHGMFSIAIWDANEKALILARDPYGIKPLYLAKSLSGEWIFASQVKAIINSKKVSNETCQKGKLSFWLYGSVQEPYTWFKNIAALKPGCFYKIIHGKLIGPCDYHPIKKFWLDTEYQYIEEQELQEVVSKAVKDSVKQHLVSDVPVGVFLSGGVDSTTIAGHMRELGASKIDAITLRFDEFKNTNEDESIFAAKFAKDLGLTHHVRTVTKSEFQADLDFIMQSMDQPSIDGINTWYASKVAAELGLKVVLSGVGGDELFHGYSSFKQIPRLSKLLNHLDAVPFLKPSLSELFKLIAKIKKNDRWTYLSKSSLNLGEIYWLKRGLYTPAEIDSFEFERVDALEFSPSFYLSDMDIGRISITKNISSLVGLLESTCYLKNQLLRDADWASMAHSVELRTPFVDINLLSSLAPYFDEFCKYNIKAMVAKSLRNNVSNEILKNKKTGFGIPIAKWAFPASRLIGKGMESREWAKLVVDRIY